MIALLVLPCLVASAATIHVWQASPSPTPPHTNWATAAYTIQDAVDAAQDGDTVLVSGGGASSSTLYNCTLTGNSGLYGGGAARSRLYNSVVYHNRAPVGSNYYASEFNYSCTSPLPGAGVGNIASDPQLASWTHLSVNSPCVGAGSALYASGLDIDGEPWSRPPCVGVDQQVPGGATGTLSVTLATDFTRMAVGYAAWFEARIEGQPTDHRWTFGDGTLVSNRLEIAHAWTVPGEYPVLLTAFNDANPGGVSATVLVQVVEQPVAYVNQANATPVVPYATWQTAATNIQDAIGASDVAGRLVWVTNGAYASGGVAVWGQITNRIALTNGVAVRGVNGPDWTVIAGAAAAGNTNGDGAIRCAYVGDGSVLSGFTLTNGHTRAEGHTSREQGGGGAWCARSGVMTNCILTGNGSEGPGGGTSGAKLYNCNITSNSAALGGGASFSELNNCIVYDNTAPNDVNFSGSVLGYCCTTPLPGTGVGNITNAPRFVNYAGGNLRLQANSPCINAGRNAEVLGDTDLDGLPRIVGGTVDIGPYEVQAPASLISYAWLQQYGLPTDGSADTTDRDGDRLNNWQEWRCGTDPTNTLSVLRLLPPLPTFTDVSVSWQSVVGVSYFLERSTNLRAFPPFLPLATNLIGQAGTTSFTDTNAAATPPAFYRVGVTTP